MTHTLSENLRLMQNAQRCCKFASQESQKIVRDHVNPNLTWCAWALTLYLFLGSNEKSIKTKKLLEIEKEIKLILKNYWR